MKGKLTNNLALKLVSVVVAFLIWATVVNISNPEVIRSKTVPVTILNGKLLTNAGKTYTVVGGDSVTVSYKVRTRDAYRISEDNFRATADMAALYTVTGSVPVEVEVTGNRELIIGTPTVRPASLQVSTEDLQNKSFSLATRVLGTPAEGFSVGSMTVDPQTVMVSGPVSIVGRISSVGVEVDVTGWEQQAPAAESPAYTGSNPVVNFIFEKEITYRLTREDDGTVRVDLDVDDAETERSGKGEEP